MEHTLHLELKKRMLGLLSVIFHGDEPNPVSVAWGDQMIMTSLMCSVTCMILVALPLFLSQLKRDGRANREDA